MLLLAMKKSHIIKICFPFLLKTITHGFCGKFYRPAKKKKVLFKATAEVSSCAQKVATNS